MKNPNFFIVGEPKCGTTTLYNLLNEHPDVFMPDDKEPSYFTKDLLEESTQFHGKNLFFRYEDLNTYLSIFEKATTQTRIGEASTRYLYSKVAAEEIHKFDPNAKIIMMLREPISFMHSLHAQYLCNPFETEKDFEKALALEEVRKKGESIPSIVKCPSLLHYRSRACFVEHIQRFLKYFNANQIFVIILEDFHSNSREIFKDVLTFLDIDAEFQPNFQVSNPNTEPVPNPLFHTIHNPKLKYWAWKLLPSKIAVKMKFFIHNLLVKEAKRAPIPEELHKKLKLEMKDDVVQLNTLLNKEGLIKLNLIDLWKY